MEEVDVLRALVKLSEAGKPVIAACRFVGARYVQKGACTQISLQTPGNHVGEFVRVMNGAPSEEFITLIIADRTALDAALGTTGVPERE